MLTVTCVVRTDRLEDEVIRYTVRGVQQQLANLPRELTAGTAVELRHLLCTAVFDKYCTIWPLVRKVVVRGRFACLRHGVALVELPGLDDVSGLRRSMTARFIRENPDASIVAIVSRQSFLKRRLTAFEDSIADVIRSQLSRMVTAMRAKPLYPTVAVVVTYTEDCFGVTADQRPLELLRAAYASLKALLASAIPLDVERGTIVNDDEPFSRSERLILDVVDIPVVISGRVAAESSSALLVKQNIQTLQRYVSYAGADWWPHVIAELQEYLMSYTYALSSLNYVPMLVGRRPIPREARNGLQSWSIVL